jgi:hypothetical protein
VGIKDLAGPLAVEKLWSSLSGFTQACAQASLLYSMIEMIDDDGVVNHVQSLCVR